MMGETLITADEAIAELEACNWRAFGKRKFALEMAMKAIKENKKLLKMNKKQKKKIDGLKYQLTQQTIANQQLRNSITEAYDEGFSEGFDTCLSEN